MAEEIDRTNASVGAPHAIMSGLTNLESGRLSEKVRDTDQEITETSLSVPEIDLSIAALISATN